MSLITFTDRGIYCPRADVYIDPWRAVDKALITHAHSDHSRPGCGKYLATHLSKPVMQHRLGTQANIQGVEYGEKIQINGVDISFHPAGHIIGSAQVRLSYKGEVWVVSGDYKVEDDGLSGAFEPVRCTHFITESTFGLPIYKWRPQHLVFRDINAWWQRNADEKKVSLISAYSLGKAQRVVHHLDGDIGPVYVHRAVHGIHEAFRLAGVAMPELPVFDETDVQHIPPGSMIVGPSAITDANWTKKIKGLETAAVSGWMQVRGIRRRRSLDRGFVLSDHADWTGLLEAIEGTGAENIFVTHGYTDVFTRYLTENGWNARVVSTEYAPAENDD
jgi:putative mRNA 3-end processing factor